jgi:hypothetical protein
MITFDNSIYNSQREFADHQELGMSNALMDNLMGHKTICAICLDNDAIKRLNGEDVCLECSTEYNDDEENYDEEDD